MTQNESRPRRRWLIAGIVVTLSLVTMSALAFGGRHHGEDGEFREFMLNRVLDSADASQEQRDQISAIVKSAHEEMRALRDGRHEELHQRMVLALTAETIDPESLDAIRADIREQMDQGFASMSQALVEAANLLDQEQRLAIAEAMEERFGERGRHHRRGF